MTAQNGYYNSPNQIYNDPIGGQPYSSPNNYVVQQNAHQKTFQLQFEDPFLAPPKLSDIPKKNKRCRKKRPLIQDGVLDLSQLPTPPPFVPTSTEVLLSTEEVSSSPEPMKSDEGVLDIQREARKEKRTEHLSAQNDTGAAIAEPYTEEIIQEEVLEIHSSSKSSSFETKFSHESGDIPQTPENSEPPSETSHSEAPPSPEPTPEEHSPSLPPEVHTEPQPEAQSSEAPEPPVSPQSEAALPSETASQEQTSSSSSELGTTPEQPASEQSEQLPSSDQLLSSETPLELTTLEPGEIGEMPDTNFTVGRRRSLIPK